MILTNSKSFVIPKAGSRKTNIEQTFVYEMEHHDGGRSISLKEGNTTVIKIEVTAEDGTTKIYQIDAKRLSASDATLSGIQLSVGELVPVFDASQLLYTCTVPYHLSSLKITPSVLDKKTAVTVNGQDPSLAEISLNIGQTPVNLEVTSADGSTKSVYSVTLLKQWLGHAVEFADREHQTRFECPVSLAPCYRPLSIAGSDPKHVFSEPIIEELTRTCKQDPLDSSVLEGDWKVGENGLETEMSAVVVLCLFSHRGCSERIKYSLLGSHIQQCTFRPKVLEDREDTISCKECSCKFVKGEEDWHKDYVCSSKHSRRDIKHSLKEHSWQKKLQETGIVENVETLMKNAKQLCKKYRDALPKKGQTKKFASGSSPVDFLHDAAVNISCAIKQNPKDPKLHYELGLVLEEQYCAKDLFGIAKESDDIDEGFADLSLDSNAKESSKEDDIQAICQQRGGGSNPSLSRQLQALDEEYRFLLDSGQSGKADYVQGLYVWKSKQATQDGKAAQAASDQETPLGKACLKYMDALSLQQNNLTYNLHTGRVLLLQGKLAEAIERFQVALSIKPVMAIVRLYLGLALSMQMEGPGKRLKEAIYYLHDGVEHILGLSILRAEEKSPSSASLLASQNICGLVHRGDTYESMQWLLLDAHTNLLEMMMEEEVGNAQWISKRCRYISSIIQASIIPQSREVLDLQEKTCQKGVIAQPTNSYALYLLGNSQLAMYENAPNTDEGKKGLADAILSFRASIAQEGKPSIGGDIPGQLTKQEWWQERLKKQESDKEIGAADKSKGSTGLPSNTKRGAPASRGTPTNRGTRGTGGAARGATAAKTPVRGSSRGATRGGAIRGGAAAKPVRGKTSAPARGTPVSRGGSQPKMTTSAKKKELPATDEAKKPAPEDAKPQSTPVPANAPLNRMTYPARLGLARALCKETEDFKEPQLLYGDVIIMAPQVHDAYIELADSLLKTEPLKAVDVYAKYPFKEESTFDDAYLHGEIVRILMKQEQFDDSRLGRHMIAWGRVMGLGCLEKYVEILDSKFKSELLKNVYAGVNRKSVDDPDLQDFFKFKMWL
ncbi:hypothetical protein BSL78_26693 [Apostichopus japonicus]|uniref:SIAH-type domain-containing protein n=1 Tax=Stichopus japonicus TaxID=307972 RepID=A0A2G8JL77_STIJA|nr:hypothetical protein BSL78_26693 [Apostichopus japonicus]